MINDREFRRAASYNEPSTGAKFRNDDVTSRTSAVRVLPRFYSHSAQTRPHRTLTTSWLTSRNLPISFFYLGNFRPNWLSSDKSGGKFSNSQQLFVQRGEEICRPLNSRLSPRFRFIKKRISGDVSGSRLRCKNISNERPGKHDSFFPLPPFLASNDLSNFKEEEGEVFSTVVDNSNGPRLVSKKCRPFSREEGIYIRGINLGYIFRENSEGLKGEICRYR